MLKTFNKPTLMTPLCSSFTKVIFLVLIEPPIMLKLIFHMNLKKTIVFRKITKPVLLHYFSPRIFIEEIKNQTTYALRGVPLRS